MRSRPPERSHPLFPRITKIVNEVDPMCLFQHGVPDDEYECEVDEILRGYLEVGPDLEALTTLVQRIFDRWFWEGSVPISQSRIIAKRLCEELAAPGPENN